MKKLGFLLCCFLVSGIVDAQPSPTVELKYARLFDPVCSIKSKYEINGALVKELREKISHWQSLWNKEGQRLLGITTKIVGLPFPQNHYTVVLSLCNYPSMSEPLIVNIRYSLKGFIDIPISNYVTISTIEHEILHTYIDSFLPKETPLLKKYQNESSTVKSHLHLFSLQKASYLKINQNDILNDVIKKDKSLPNGEYKRAWEIVTSEGYKKFIDELVTFSLVK